MKGQIIIVYGGTSCEHDISIITALYAYNAANLQAYEKTLVYLRNGEFFIGDKLKDISSYIDFQKSCFDRVFFYKGGMYRYKKPKKCFLEVDCALICAHGGEGENGALQGYFEIADIAYTSAKVYSSSLLMDKVKTKKALEYKGYSVLPYCVVKKEGDCNYCQIEEKLGYPVIIKPARLGSSIGIAKAKNREELDLAVETGLMYDDKLLVEKCLDDFMEINIAAMKSKGETILSIPERPIIDGDFLTFEDKYVVIDKCSLKKEIPAKIAKRLESKLNLISQKLYEDFELDGVVRIDYLIKDKEIFVNEINTIPGSLAYYLFAPKDINMTKLVNILVEEAIEYHKKQKKLIKNFSSNILSHYNGNKVPPIKK
ncbi:MAG: ATP-grasp domain-containing protein [Bacillota bacterium]|jgi:D-alanine-D-alanine ligase|nr:ATP-grasp domain-containing protein [Bacillota bacterium]HHU43631.1 ATP-grasp domain-containing protein [Clostridiales bacterium]